MICYQDKTFCTRSDCARFGKDCDRSLTEEVKRRAEKWWGTPGAPICTYAADLKPDCFVAKDIERKLAELQLKFMDQSSEVLELRKDKERLDWLLKNCLIKELDLEWVHDSREAIDEAMDYTTIIDGITNCDTFQKGNNH